MVYLCLSPTLTYAMESLQHGIEHYLEGSPTSRKFAFMHIDHAIELVLKEKIILCGRSIFKNNNATLNLHECFKSLERENIKLHEHPRLEELHDIRNTIQHRGLIPDENLTEFYVKEAYNFLKDFLGKHIGIELAKLLPNRIINIMEGIPLKLLYRKAYDLLEHAKHQLKTNNTVYAVINAAIAVDIMLSERYKGKIFGSEMYYQKLRDETKKLGVDNKIDWHNLKTILQIRNNTVHRGNPPNVKDAKMFVKFVEDIVNVLDSIG